MRQATHPGPSGHPSKEGSFFYPLSGGVPRSGGVGLTAERVRQPTPALRATKRKCVQHRRLFGGHVSSFPPRRGAFFIPSREGCRVSGGVGLTAERTREPTPAYGHKEEMCPASKAVWRTRFLFPSKEGIENPAPRPFLIPSWEGCRVSGGVGYPRPDSPHVRRVPVPGNAPHARDRRLG